VTGDPAAGVDDASPIGWGRAVATAIGLLVVGLGASVEGANTVLTRMTSLTRDTRALLATVLFLAVVVAMAWLLRRLQARGLV